jgi:tRNA-splicing ligase RtcB
MISRKDLNKITDFLWEIPQGFRSDMKAPARFYTSEKMIDGVFRDESLNQLINGATLPGIINYALAMPDMHEGYSVPIGFVGAVSLEDGVISPGACGFDINCGMRLLKSQWLVKDIKPYLENLAQEIQNEVPSGLGQGKKVRLSNTEIEHILEGGANYLVKKGFGSADDLKNCEAGGRLGWAKVNTVSQLAKSRGRDQVGTLGSGNHFLEVQKVAEIFDENTAQAFGLFPDQVIIMIHCGSRGLGHQVCTDYLKEFIPLMERKYRIQVPDQEFACVPFSSPEGQRYFAAMAAAANFAWANRQMITHSVRQAWIKVIKGNSGELTQLYDVAHNIIKIENHLINGRQTQIVVHRKGATRAFPPGHPEVPEQYRSVGQPVLIPGSMGTASYVLAGTLTGEQSFFSTCHGAGRAMSRHQALRTITGQEVVRQLNEKGILIKCQSFRGIAEEAPLAYKNIDEVVEVVHQAGLSKKVARLVPLAVIKGE